jgi:hypothetical protein
MAEVVLRKLEPSVERLLEWHLAAVRDGLPPVRVVECGAGLRQAA